MNTTEITVAQSKTKSGKIAQVAVIPEALVIGEGPEGMHWRSVELAQARGCSHYRVVAADGRIVMLAKAGALPTEAQIARTHGGY
jgi:hypothetical protein